MFQSELGVSYTDSFLSNQIRYNLIDRDVALEKLKKSKKVFAEKIFQAMDILEMNELKDKIDVNCFKIDT